MATLKTKIHFYLFEETTPEYLEMVRQIEANGVEGRGKWTHVMSSGREKGKHTGDILGIVTDDVELDTEHVFNNQWGEIGAPSNRRLFDWYEEAVYYYNGRKSDKHQGHWLEITPEMIKVRKECLKCGYCGHQYGPLHDTEVPENGFCAACLDSDYLQEGNLLMLRLLPLVGDQDRGALTVAEWAVLLPLYLARQFTDPDSRSAKERAASYVRVNEKFEKETRDALTERDGMLWLWERKLPLSNVLFYAHTGHFGFGWRSKVSNSVVEQWLVTLKDFPFDFEIECEDGKRRCSRSIQPATDQSPEHPEEII